MLRNPPFWLQTAFHFACCCDTILVWLSCGLAQCFASAVCVMGGKQGDVSGAECATYNCLILLAFGKTNVLLVVEIAVSDASVKCLCNIMP